MPRGFLDDAARTALADSVKAIEGASSVEVVVAVRARARVWLHAHLVAGFVAAWLALAFMLYSDHAFGLASFLVDPAVAAVLAGVLTAFSPPLVRALTPRGVRRRAVAEAARAAFYERGVHHTRGRTGVLVYVALTERMAELVPDDAVVQGIEPGAWRKACAAIDAAVVHGGVATARALAGLAPLAMAALPRHATDENELPDAIDDGSAPPAPARTA